MINVINNEKAEEGKKTSETDFLEDHEDAATENAEEGFEMEEVSISETRVPSDTSEIGGGISLYKGDLLEEQSVMASEEQRICILKEKFLKAVGRRPEFVPHIKIYPEELEGEGEDQKKKLSFGERRPYMIGKKRMEKWQDIAKNIKPVKFNPARVLLDVMLPAMNEGVLCVRFEDNGQSFALSFRNGGVEVRDTYNGEVLAHFATVESKETLPARAVRYHPYDNKKLYVGGASGIVQVFDLELSANIGNSKSVNQICNMDLNMDGTTLITAGRNSRIVILDPCTLQVRDIRERGNTNDFTQSSLNDYHKLRIYGLKCHPSDPNVFLTGGWDSTVKIWDLRASRPTLTITGPWINGDALDILEDQILTASWRAENSVQLWDYFSGKLIKQIPVTPKPTVHEGEFLYTAKFFKNIKNLSKRGNFIAVAGNGFFEVSVVDVENEKVIAFFPSHKGISSLDTSGNLVGYGGKESIFRIGELNLSHKSRGEVSKKQVF